jgi:UDP-4-amino-4,6-dideoxy-N-acetyl-beta-L-altrosamine transaminase
MTNKPTTGFMPYGRQCIDEDDIAAVADVLRGDWLTTGPAVAAFEEALADCVGARHAVACSSGTAALHLTMLALGLGPRDAVIVPSITFLATANAARYVGAEVLFADVDPATGLMTVSDAENALTRAGDLNVRAVLPVHLNGQCADPSGFAELGRTHGLRIIADASHALGTHYTANGENFSIGACQDDDMTVFSFHPVKTIAMGEGGAVMTNDDALAERLRRFRNHGMIHDPADLIDADGVDRPWYYEMQEIGFNYRASDIHCALVHSQLKKLDRFVAMRRELVAQYDARFATLSPIIRPIERVPTCQPGWHLYPARLDFAALGMDRGEVMIWLRERGIGTQVHYIPVHQQPYYRQQQGNVDLPGAEAYYASILSLPLYPAMTAADVDRVVDALTTLIAAPKATGG